MGFSVGDIFGKNFLSADTIIGGQKKTFNASVSNVPGLGSRVTLANLIQYYQDQAGTYAQRSAAKDVIQKLLLKSGNSNVDLFNLTSGTPKSFFRFSSNDTIVIDSKKHSAASGNQAFHITPKAGYSMKFRVKVYDDQYLSKRSKRPKNSAGKDLPDATGMSNSGYAQITDYVKTSGTGEQVTIVLNGDDGDYLSVDMGGNSGIAAFLIQIKGAGRFEGNSPQDYMNTVAVTLVSISKNPVLGCNDSAATNYNSKATTNDGSCVFETSKINSFSINKSSMKVGDPVKITWKLKSGDFDEIQVLSNGSNIMPADKKALQNSNFEDTPTAQGEYKYQLKVIWNKGTAQPVTSSIKSLNVQALPSYIQCTDPNREQNDNGECASCKTNYYLDSTSGLCSQCTDPNREKLSDGKCGDCNSGFSLKDGTCQKAGCTTEGNYNYDETAVVHDESMCYDDTEDTVDCELSEWGDWSEWSDWSDTDSGTRTRTRNRTIVTEPANDGVACESTEETETETKDPETGDVVKTTTAADPVRARVTPTESSFPIIPVVGGVLLLGVLLLRR